MSGGRLLESVGGKVSIRLPLFSQAAGRWPSWVTQMRGVLFNVKPSLSEKAAGHLPLWGPTNTVDAGQISAFPAAFQPEASKANRNGTVSWDILARGQVACVLGSVYASEPEYAPRGPCSPHPTLPAFCSAWPPLPALRLRTPIPAFPQSQGSLHGANEPMPVIFCVCVCTLLPALS